MYHNFAITSCIILCFVSSAFPQHKEEKETIKRTFTFADADAQKQLTIDAINGYIKVTGHKQNNVEVVVYKTIFARNAANLEEAKDKITLEITQQGNAVDFYVDAPYRCDDGSVNYRGCRRYGYDVHHDFKVKVPHRTSLALKTINDGEISVRDVRGDFNLENINDGIEAIEVAGAGRIYTLNGDVRVEFSENPRSDCFFGSLNGEVDVFFKAGLSADLRIKTFNGEIYTDFEVSYLPPRPAKQERKGAKFIYKSDEAFGARIGDGGPVLEFDSFNGDVYIAKK